MRMITNLPSMILEIMDHYFPNHWPLREYCYNILTGGLFQSTSARPAMATLTGKVGSVQSSPGATWGLGTTPISVALGCPLSSILKTDLPISLSPEIWGVTSLKETSLGEQGRSSSLRRCWEMFRRVLDQFR